MAHIISWLLLKGMVAALRSLVRQSAHARRLPLIGTSLALALAAFTHAQPAAPLGLTLPQNAQGAAAIQALGTHLPAVAQAYGLDPQKLVTLLQTQPSLAVDRSGALHFVCSGLALQPGTTLTVQEGTATSVSLANATGSTDASDAFRLHSLPGCTRVIYLDFDGHVTSGTSWNSSYAGGADIVSQPFDGGHQADLAAGG
jgi:hypothetical protein